MPLILLVFNFRYQTKKYIFSFDFACIDRRPEQMIMLTVYQSCYYNSSMFKIELSQVNLMQALILHINTFQGDRIIVFVQRLPRFRNTYIDSN